jgi:hypothetical protein
MGPDMDDDFSEELDARLGRFSDLVNMVSSAYSQDGFLSNRDTYVMVMRKDKQAEAQALQALQKSALGTPLESDALSQCKSLEEAQKLLARQMSAQRGSSGGVAAAATAPRDGDGADLRTRNAELERAAAQQQRRIQELEAVTRTQEQRALDLEQEASRQKDDVARLSAALSTEAQRSHAAAERRMREAEALGQSYRESLGAERARAELLTQQLLEAKQAQVNATQETLRLEEERAQLQRELDSRRDLSLVMGSSAEVSAESSSRSFGTPASTVMSSSVLSPSSELPVHDDAASSAGSLAEFSVAMDDLDDILGGVSQQTPVVQRRAEQEAREAAAIAQRGGSFAGLPASAPAPKGTAAAPPPPSKESVAERELTAISSQLRAIVAEYADTSRSAKQQQQGSTPAQNLQRIREEFERLKGEEGVRVQREQVCLRRRTERFL